MKKETVRRVLKFINPYRGFVIMSFVFSFIGAAAQLAVPIFCGNAIDAMMSFGNVDYEAVFAAVILIVVAAVAGAAAQEISTLCNNRITFSVCRDIRNEISKKINRLPIAYLDSHPTGDTVSRAVADVDSFADGLLMGFTQLFTGVITIAATLIIMFYLNVIVAAAVVLLTPLSIFAARFIAVRTSKFFRKQAEIRGEQTALINELTDGARVVKAFGREKETKADFDEINQRLEKAALKATFFSSLTNPTTRMINNVVYAAVIFISAFYAIGGGISIGQLSVFLSYASQYAKPFNEISGVVTELQNAFTCAQRVFDLLDEDEEISDAEFEMVKPQKAKVEFSNVSFRYNPEKPLIEDLSISIEPGKKIAIVGPTGCGKTTIINLLMRFYDVTDGKIMLDGRDIRKMNRKNLRAHYAMVLQDTWLSCGTVKENIAYAKPDATDEEITEAAKKAHAHSFIRRLPEGYDTVITENGGNLSAGQRQLLCIARAMLFLPHMLILDEATSSVDTRTEKKIQAAFSQMMQGRTTFIVAHRLSTIKEADMILVMRDGKIIETGNHESLLKKGGLYTRLHNSQFEHI